MNDVLNHNRVILCHFDSYSTALVFARYDGTILAPSPLPEGASAGTAPSDTSAVHEPTAALNALTAQFALDPAQLTLETHFQEWAAGPEGPIGIHLARFTTFEAPKELMQAHGAVFTPISQMRGAAPIELNFLRQAFNLIMGGH